MGPEKPLPLPPEFSDADSYLESLLNFGTSSQLLQTLCGGVHILDFFTRTPDLYTLVLPLEWREWFKSVDIMDILDLLIREDLVQFEGCGYARKWGDHEPPPTSLISYIRDVRKHLLNRDSHPITGIEGAKHTMNHLVAMGMSVKKVHEVDHFARYVDKLTSDIAKDANQNITHLVDFGSGQNYLGRALASEPYSKNIIAVESRPHVVEGAKKMDVIAKLAEKKVVRRNKKAFRAGLEPPSDSDGSPTPIYGTDNANCIPIPSDRFGPLTNGDHNIQRATLELPKTGKGSIQYVQHRITNGDLTSVIAQIASPSPLSESPTASSEPPANPALMVISLHSCGNLLHHGLRTLTLNPSVKAVAMIGCCYNLLTEHLGPPTFKNPILRGRNHRLKTTAAANDEHGFPMSEQFARYRRRIVKPCGYLRSGASNREQEEFETGIRINITARMMAVQAPANWSEEGSAGFFTRHFYRAVLQRIFLDKGIVEAPGSAVDGEERYPVGGGVSPAGTGASQGTPVVIGTLGKKCYSSFVAYVRGAVAKIAAAPHYEGDPIVLLVKERVGSMTDEDIMEYERRFLPRKKELEVVWSLMAFSAGVVEAMIVVDRWLWLKEQECVERAWVESVFEYGRSPRNLVVVGIKRPDC